MDSNGKRNIRVNTSSMQHMRQTVDGLLASPAPAREIARLLAGTSSPNATMFERYAGLALRDAEVDRLTQLPPQRAMRLVPPGDGHLVQIILPKDATDGERDFAQSTQGAINRLCCIIDALEDSADLDEDPFRRKRVSISFLGADFRPSRPSYRSAHIRLPEIGVSEEPGLAYLNEMDWRVLDHVCVIARTVFQSSLLPNMYQAFMGASARPGSDWDVRTRLASILEKLELPLSSQCEFDCNIPASSAQVRFILPSARCFPQRIADAGDGGLKTIGELVEQARFAYGLRLACLLAAACFGSGRRIEHAHVTCEDTAESAGFSCCFNRHDFVHKTLASIESGALLDPAVRFDVPAVKQLIAAESFTSGDEDPDTKAGSSAIRIPPHEDERVLPKDLQGLFHAHRICDIDTRHFFGGRAHVIEEARLDSNDSILAAIARLESTIEELESRTAPPDDDASARPLFCSNPLARATVSLLDDEYAVSMEAEAYLNGLDVNETSPEDLPRYFRAPDALFQAHVGLSDLYFRLGDYKGAESEADRCIALAPTTAQSYYLKADALAQQDRYAEAANTLCAGLRYAVAERDCALLYYHLGLVLWKLGREQESGAVQVYASSLSGEYADKAATIVQSLRKRGNGPVVAHASPLAAAREMTRARIPLAPSDEARVLIVRAAVGLSCADAPEAAAPYATALARYFRNDTVIADVARSLAYGILGIDG